ncbi:S9 family peptidase [Sphingomonas sp. AP4-R1]|uniref:alpha/beta hydrolase family protein n=1 Tax=Sphingomonas sp. AP4-R1 TaxID=2735134 RepID=UPI00149357A9|nr:alpha/beta fold hydrolase [Sphingomonas sp. AP4-R1]QJU56401.1 S9 family peptidase [Sphingomonas sp. AP4-R1]
MQRFLVFGGAAALLWVAVSAQAELPPLQDTARKFGAREHILDASLSPDGAHVVYIIPGKGKGTIALVTGADGKDPKLAAMAAGDPLNLRWCNWSAADRIVCIYYGITDWAKVPASHTRTVSFDLDGKNVQYLGRRPTHDELRVSQYDGEVIDWLSGGDGKILMARDYVPQDVSQSGSAGGTSADGIGVDLIDTRTGISKTVEPPVRGRADYISDGRGVVRIMSTDRARGAQSILSGTTINSYRLANERAWRPFSTVESGSSGALRPLAVDGEANVAYALKTLDGRDALYRVALDGSMKADLAYANPVVDVRGTIMVGRSGRVIGASYITDSRQVEYFDPAYRKLQSALARAIPNLPVIRFISASADEQKLLIWAGSDVDPGQYLYFDKATRHLDRLTAARPELEGTKLSAQKSISYPASDGKMVPAYLTLPPGSDGKHLPTIVMPHGGPASRDDGGFDWLAQFFAQRGFAVLQPEFRGSAGYGDAWFVDNGFKSWKAAIGDIADGAHWLVKEGVADPGQMAIVGWSYGGYAALQSAAVDPALFKAVVAIAPIADLGQFKAEHAAYTNGAVVARYVGDGAHIADGSPARHADRFQAPVLMFHGDQDINVDVAQSRTMDRALRAAGKRSELVIETGLDHQIEDGDVRAGLLMKTDTFLRANLKMPPAD